MDMTFNIIVGDSLINCKKITDDGIIVNCVVTSPPYFQKREYGKSNNEIGKEKNIKQYIDSLVSLFNSIPLHDKGSIWVNIGDKRKNGLLMIPEQFALAMIDGGWTLADNVIWAKIYDDTDGSTYGNCMTEPAHDRLNGNGFENLYRFIKADKLSNAWSDVNAVSIPRKSVVSERYLPEQLMECETSIEGRSLHNVWRIKMGQTKEKHFAVYPPELCERPIAMTCPMWITPDGNPVSRIVEMREYDECRSSKRVFGKYNSIDDNYTTISSGRMDCGKKYVARKPVTIGWNYKNLESCSPGIVLDPFCGTGTTGEIALKLGRSFIGFDLYENFAQISKDRCSNVMKWLKSNNLNPRKLSK